jgi:uncharacterized surface protein with fasciclin (FAS1) repeats
MNRTGCRVLAAAGAAVAVAGLGACGDEGDAGGTAASSAASVAPDAPVAEDPTAKLVGSGCADYAAAVPEGAGSLAGMAKAPLTSAAAGNPMLTTLASAVSGKLNPRVNLATTLDAGPLTVFAPIDEAFAKIPPATQAATLKDPALLRKVLTYHVVRGRIGPDRIAGTHTTLEGGTVRVTGAGDKLKVNGATVICGGVETTNATVYLIDTLLIPKR